MKRFLIIIAFLVALTPHEKGMADCLVNTPTYKSLFCSFYSRTNSCSQVSDDDEILIQTPNSCSFCKAKISDLQGPDPVVIGCSNKTQGFGVRYRNFDNGPSQQILLGHIGTFDQTATNYTWQTPELYQFNFTYVPGAPNDYVTQTLTSPTSTSQYPSSTPPGLTAILASLTPPVNINDLNSFSLLVANTFNVTNNEVILQSLTLTTSTTVIYNVIPNIIPPISPVPGTVTEIFFSWPSDGSTPAEGSTFRGSFYISGNFTGSAEGAKVEIQINKCSNS